ncbi:MAG: hypothetical protein KKH88_03585 [Nanoarchaeota archaeon]|nr:hypothetical protein [Nanoarchaeota archaeon]
MVKKKKVVKSSKNTKKAISKDYDIAYDFSIKAYKKFQEVIKSVILFGSVPQKKKKRNDIDIIIIIDDCTIQWDQELIAWYREELGKLIAEQNYKREIHINTVTLSAFWEEVKEGDPVVINIIRYGQALIDFGGFFDPLKVMLAKGRIRPTPEAIFNALRRAPIHISKAKLSIINSIEGLYWAMVDSSHAALMAANVVPPSPEYVGEMLYDAFVKHKKLDKKYVSWYIDMYELMKDVTHGNIKKLEGKEIDKHMKKAEEFERVMRRITTKLIEKEKIIRIEKKKI